MDRQVAEIAAMVSRIRAGAADPERSRRVADVARSSSSASTEQVSASAQRTSASAQEIAASAQRLAGQAARLDERVDQFVTAR